VADKEVICSHGSFRLRAFRDQTCGDVHLALTRGEIRPENETLVRVHEPVSVLDFLDCKSHRHTFSIDQAMEVIAKADRGAIVLLHRNESGTDLLDALHAEETRPALKWDSRLYGIGAQILRELGVGKMRLLASPRKMPSMAGFGLEVCGYLSSEELSQ
jgi:3,4-dihydroxy 2-butanone 4-phosphate synthase/GTP cyclohydrolase II